MNAEIRLVSDTVTPALMRLQASLTNPSPAMAKVANILDRSVKANFRSQGRPGKWEALKPSTAKGLVTKTGKRRGYGHILISSGDMRKSIQARSGRDYAEVGAAGVVPAVHQFGTNRAGRGRSTRIPRRPFIGSTNQAPNEFRLIDQDEKAIVKVIDDFIMKGQ